MGRFLIISPAALGRANLVYGRNSKLLVVGMEQQCGPVSRAHPTNERPAAPRSRTLKPQHLPVPGCYEVMGSASASTTPLSPRRRRVRSNAAVSG